MVERFRPASRTEADGIGEVLRAIVGPEHVRTATDADSISGIAALVVVEPADYEKEQTGQEVENANAFVIDRGKPREPMVRPHRRV